MRSLPGRCPSCHRATKAGRLLPQIPEWALIKEDNIECLRRIYPLKNFAAALAFTNKVGELAEREAHHPALLTEWGRVTITWWTHKIKGLHINDFIMAAKTDQNSHETLSGLLLMPEWIACMPGPFLTRKGSHRV